MSATKVPLKDYPTDREYASNPEYYKDCVAHNELHFIELKKKADELGNNNELNALKNMIAIIGIQQIQLEQIVSSKTIKQPKWQKNEMKERAKMLQKVMKYVEKIIQKRMVGL